MAVPARVALLERTDIRGVELARELSATTDAWLVDRFGEAVDGVRRRVALVAVGGYGRNELAPCSDLDLWLVHDSVKSIGSVAERLWYPIWDAKLALGHAVRTPKEALSFAAEDLETATALLSCRLIAGDADLANDLAVRAAQAWRRNATRWLGALRVAVDARHDEQGEVAYLLEPQLKEGVGGLRDAHALAWAQSAGADGPALGDGELREAYDTLLGIRVELHRSTGRSGDVLVLQEQSSVAERLGFPDADELMGAVAAAGRTLAWASHDAWTRIGRSLDKARGVSFPERRIAHGVQLVDGEVHLDAGIDVGADPSVVLRVARGAARSDSPIARSTLDRLEASLPVFSDPWPPGARDDLHALLVSGHAAIPVLEALDQRSLLTRVLPEWALVRSKPQRNAYHRFTVDRHLWEAVANAAALVDRVSRPDLLLLGTLLHDLGKGQPGDHTDNGVTLAETIGPRLGLEPDDVAIVVDLVRLHLLLPDVATRRDLGDDATIDHVANLVGDRVRLELLAALTEADSLATGSSAWSSWKAELVDELVRRVGHVLGGGRPGDLPWALFPTTEVADLMATGERHVVVAADRITTIAPDRAGLFSRVAGVLALHGLDVIAARAHSEDPLPGRSAMAANEFRFGTEVKPSETERLRVDVLQALAGHLAIEARLAERARLYRRRRQLAVSPIEPTVRIEPATDSTIIEVRTADHVGVLYRVTKALADLALDLRHATVQTLGAEVVDTFYVRSEGRAVTDAVHLAEVRRAVLHALGSSPTA